MQIDPKVALWIKVILGLLTAVTNGSLAITGILTPAEATQITAVCSSLIVVIGIVMTAFSSSAPGPLAPPDPPGVVAATKVAADANAAGK